MKDSAAGDPPGPDAPPPTTWREPTVYDVFEEDGSYLGEVRVPPRVSLMVLGRDTVWGTRLGEHDEPYIVRLRLVPLTDRDA